MTNASLQFPPTDEEYRDNIRRQKSIAHEIAEKLRAGKPLSEVELSFAAYALKSWAGKLSETMPKPKSRPPKINHSSVARDYVLLRQDGMSATKAKDKLATEYGVDVDTIANAIDKKGKDAEALYSGIRRKK